MCGIAGILDPRGVSEADIRRMTSTLAHRGPDDATIHVESGLALGFRRLSIIDLETGAQPIANEDGSVLVICNGEIYNYRELRRDLQKRGHRFQTRSDIEVIVHLYEERGSELVYSLRGMFALALWDRNQRRLLLARDHFGQKPLYWAERNGRTYFASEIKAILSVAPAFREVDPYAFDEYLSLRIISAPRSMFAGISKLPAAHLLETDGERTESLRYWSLRYEPKSLLSEQDALDRTGHMIEEAVRLHMVSDVPVGSFLSGGVDSGLITAVMARVADEPFETFSVGVPYEGHDETGAARLVSRMYKTRHHESFIDGDLVRTLPTCLYHLDEPSDSLSVCLYHLASVASQYVKVALGGDGGDELFGGYDRYYGVPLVSYFAALPLHIRQNVLGRIIDMIPDGFWYKSLSHRLRWMKELAGSEGGKRYARSLGYFYFSPRMREDLYSDRFARLSADFDAEESIVRWYEDDRLKSTLDRMLLADSMIRLPNHSITILDRMTMAHGLEARSPLLDHRLAEFVASLPARLKIRGSKRRVVEMKLAERYLPRELLARPKQGFASALPYVMGKQFEALFHRFLTDSHLIEAGWLQPEPISQMLSAHLEGQADHGNRLWLLLSAELWHRLHIEGVAVEELEAELAQALDSAGTVRRPPRTRRLRRRATAKHRKISTAHENVQ